MRKIAATLLALAPAAPAVACDHPPVALATGYAVQACACPDPAADAFAASSVQTYSAPVVTLAPVVQSYQSATVALPTVTHSYSASASSFSAGHSYAFGAGHGHDAFSVAQLRAQRDAELAVARARFARDAHRADARAFDRDLAAARQDAFAARPHIGRRPPRRPGILGRIFGR